ncbi:hypothetical protein ANAPH2_00507 [Anaplasma phagocytophilum]|nr:hypothetical protein ANAPH2_00507 [Anaplasma phagocytophilum]
MTQHAKSKRGSALAIHTTISRKSCLNFPQLTVYHATKPHVALTNYQSRCLKGPQQCSENCTVYNVLNPACSSTTPSVTQHAKPNGPHIRGVLAAHTSHRVGKISNFQQVTVYDTSNHECSPSRLSVHKHI